MKTNTSQISFSVALLAVGIGLILIGSVGVLPVGSPPPSIDPPSLRLVFIIVGFLASLASIVIYIRWDKESSISLGRITIRQKIASIVGKDKQYPFIFSSRKDFANITYLREYIETNEVERAKLVQYSGDKVMAIIELLLEKGAKVELLLQDPRDLFEHREEKKNSYQLNKIRLFQDKMRNEFDNRENLTVRYYKEPASLRAVKFDEALLSMGWYTYRHRQAETKEPWLYGHSNVAISVRIDNVDVQGLVETFDDVFLALWKTSTPHADLEPEIDEITMFASKMAG